MHSSPEIPLSHLGVAALSLQSSPDAIVPVLDTVGSSSTELFFSVAAFALAPNSTYDVCVIVPGDVPPAPVGLRGSGSVVTGVPSFFPPMARKGECRNVCIMQCIGFLLRVVQTHKVPMTGLHVERESRFSTPLS